MKKILLTIALATGFFALIFSCDNNCEGQLEYWNITGIDSLKAMDTNGAVVTNTFAGSSLVLELNFGVSYTAENDLTPNFAAFGLNTCLAMAKKDCTNGLSGMKDPITSISVYSDADFGIYPKDTALDDIVTIEGHRSSTWIANGYYNYMVPYYYGTVEGLRLQLEITEKPASGSTHLFVVELVTADGRKFRSYLPAITWN